MHDAGKALWKSRSLSCKNVIVLQLLQRIKGRRPQGARIPAAWNLQKAKQP